MPGAPARARPAWTGRARLREGAPERRPPGPPPVQPLAPGAKPKRRRWDVEAPAVAAEGAACAATLPEPSSVYLWEVSFDDSPEPRLADLDRTALAEQALRDLRLVSEMDAPADLRPFGLTRDGIRLDVLDASAQRHRYEIGGFSPDGEKRYILHRASDRLLLVKGDSLAIFEEDPWALVDGRLLPIDPLSIREIRVEGPDRGAPIELRRRSENWLIEGSISVPAGTSEVRDFLRRAASLSEDTPTQPDASQSAALSLLVRDGEGVSARLDFSPLPMGRLWVAHASGDLLPARARGRTFLVERATTDFLRVAEEAFLPGASAAADAGPEVGR